MHFCSKHFLVYRIEVQSGLIFFLSLTQSWVQKLHRIATPPNSLSSKNSKAGVSQALITFKFQTKCDSCKKNRQKLQHFPVFVFSLSNCYLEADVLNILSCIPAEVVIFLYAWHWPRKPWLLFDYSSLL